MKDKIVRKYVEDESAQDYERMLDERDEKEQSLKKSMVGHLSALNDGVVAIFITVMMLELPYPTSKEGIPVFLWSIGVFLVSFFIIAHFWYDNKRIFESIREADHWVVVADFVFLASLALIPATTKWIMNETNRYASMTFGLVYILTTIFQQLLYYAAVKNRFHGHGSRFILIALSGTGLYLLIGVALIALSWFDPVLGHLLFIVIPILGFFRPRGRKHKKKGGTGAVSTEKSKKNE